MTQLNPHRSAQMWLQPLQLLHCLPRDPESWLVMDPPGLASPLSSPGLSVCHHLSLPQILFALRGSKKEMPGLTLSHSGIFQQPVLRGGKGSSWLHMGYLLKELSFLSKNPGDCFLQSQGLLSACPQCLTLSSDNPKVGLGVWDAKSPT